MNVSLCLITKRGEMIVKRVSLNVIRRWQTSSRALSEIQIPNRIKRSPTDILKALEKTISRDPTAAHYKFHDDPFLLPRSSAESRSYALSRESGRKAAMWIRQEHSNLFQHQVADPPIMSLLPPPTYMDKSNVSEEILLSAIAKNQVKEATQIYHLLECNVSTETKQALLELLCFFNGQENHQTFENFLEERWYCLHLKSARNTWKDNTDITTLFEQLKIGDTMTVAAAYSTMICGLAKYLNKQKAWKLYEECNEKNIPLNVHAYNSLIHLLPTLKEGSALRSSVLEFFKLMTDNGVQPNIDTLNAALRVSTFLKNSKIAKEYISSVISEFRRLNIQPSLASYCYILIVYYHQGNNDNPSSDTLEKILQDLKNQKLAAYDPRDILFFPTAMEVAAQVLHNYDLAQKVHALLLTSDNYKFINSNYAEALYYKMYTTVRLKTEPLKEFMEFYENIVPNIYIPESDVISDLLETFRFNSAASVRDYLPKIWSHIVMFNFVEIQHVLEKILSIMCTFPSPESALNKQFADAALFAWNHIQEKQAKRLKNFVWKGSTLGSISVLLVRADYLEEMLQILSFILNNEGSIHGTMSDEQLKEILMKCVLNGHAPGAIQILEYAADINNGQLESMANKVYQALPLTVTQDAKLTTIVGSDSYKSTEFSNNDN